MHLATDELAGALPRLGDVRAGVAHLFIQHTSAALSLNENAFARRALAA